MARFPYQEPQEPENERQYPSRDGNPYRDGTGGGDLAEGAQMPVFPGQGEPPPANDDDGDEAA